VKNGFDSLLWGWLAEEEGVTHFSSSEFDQGWTGCIKNCLH
jgi:hypothetical protein